MKEFKCPKCKSRDVFIKKSGNNTGLYCGDCGAWIKWLNKNEIRLAQRQIEMNEKELDELTKQIGGKDNFSIGVKLYIIDKESKDHTEYYIPYRIEGLRELEYIEYEEINE